MDSKSLMIGDWVLIGNNHIRITSLQEGKDYVEAQPIPLTAEILEKNGFVEEAYGWRKLNAANWCININIFNGKERYALCVLGTNAQVTLHGYYVHELQHALRLCGIDKTIEL